MSDYVRALLYLFLAIGFAVVCGVQIQEPADLWISSVGLAGINVCFAAVEGWRLKRGKTRNWSPFITLLLFSHLVLLREIFSLLDLLRSSAQH